MELAIVNGSNAIARGVIKKMAPHCSKIKLLDHRPYRKSVYALQRAIPASCELEKIQTQSGKAIEYALEGSDQVLYFTHDYLGMTHDKNSFLKRAAISCQRVGAGKLVAVSPIELDMHYTETKHSSIEYRDEAEHEALTAFENTAILRPNLVFGEGAHFIHYLTQCAFAGRVPSMIGGASSYQFNPVHVDDLTTSITTAFENMDEAKGQRWNVNGNEKKTVADIMAVVERATGKGHAKHTMCLGLTDLVEEWFSGIAHDKNLGKMVQWYEENRPNLNEHNFAEKFGVQLSQSFTEHYTQLGKVNESDFVTPLFSSYKQVSLD